MLDPPEDRKVSFLARPNMSTVDVTHTSVHGQRRMQSVDRSDRLLRLLLHALMRLARALRLCIAARRVRSTRGLQGQLPRKTQHEHG